MIKNNLDDALGGAGVVLHEIELRDGERDDLVALHKLLECGPPRIALLTDTRRLEHT
jgi:hypothetical protein